MYNAPGAYSKYNTPGAVYIQIMLLQDVGLQMLLQIIKLSPVIYYKNMIVLYIYCYLQ